MPLCFRKFRTTRDRALLLQKNWYTIQVEQLKTIIPFFFLLWWAAVAGGCNSTTPAAPAQTVITVQGLQNRVVMIMDKQTAVFNIHSQTGIGNAQVQRDDGHWPQPMVLHFHLSGLEEMTLTYGETAVTLNISSQGDNEIRQSVHDAAITAEDARWLAVAVTNTDGTPGVIPLQEGLIAVTLPPEFHAVAPASFTIQWIDFYR